MDLNLIDKLRILKIDTELRPEIKMKPMSRYYFITSSNPGEQFFVFASTAAWLIRKSGKEFEQPREEDDPNSLIATILEVLRTDDVALEFPPQKLKQGYGEQVCFVLNALADKALKATNFEWLKPIIHNDADETIDDPDQVEDETEIILDKVEDEMEIYSDDSEGEMKNENKEDDQQNTVQDLEAWKLELERVAPALRIKIAADGRDWRTRHSQMQAYKEELLDRLKVTIPQLNKLQTSLSSTMDKIYSRENILNEQFEQMVKEYGVLMEELDKLNKEYKEACVDVAEQQEILNDLNAKVESVKQKTESRGSSMNDNSPLVTVKKALATLKKDTQELDFQIMILIWLLITKENPNSNTLLATVDSLELDAEVY